MSPKRTLRSRRVKTKTAETIVINDDDVSAKEERELEVAIALSLKTNGNNGSVEEVAVKSVTTKLDPYEHVDKTIELFRYPFIHGIDNEISFRMEDYLCLGKAEYLSDVIIDFVFSYFYNEKFTDEMREKVYVFPTSFYSIYSTSSDYPGWNSEENANKTALQKRYERVERMLDMNVNIFDKEFLVFPLFQSNHWFLSIVCFPKLIENLIYADDTPTEDCVKRNPRRIDDPSYNPTPLKWSCILTFDSIKSNAARRSTAMKHIRGFLNSHHERFYKDQFDIGKLTACSVQVSFNFYLQTHPFLKLTIYFSVHCNLTMSIVDALSLNSLKDSSLLILSMTFVCHFLRKTGLDLKMFVLANAVRLSTLYVLRWKIIAYVRTCH